MAERNVNGETRRPVREKAGGHDVAGFFGNREGVRTGSNGPAMPVLSETKRFGVILAQNQVQRRGAGTREGAIEPPWL